MGWLLLRRDTGAEGMGSLHASGRGGIEFLNDVGNEENFARGKFEGSSDGAITFRFTLRTGGGVEIGRKEGR